MTDVYLISIVIIVIVCTSVVLHDDLFGSNKEGESF